MKFGGRLVYHVNIALFNELGKSRNFKGSLLADSPDWSVNLPMCFIRVISSTFEKWAKYEILYPLGKGNHCPRARDVGPVYGDFLPSYKIWDHLLEELNNVLPIVVWCPTNWLPLGLLNPQMGRVSQGVKTISLSMRDCISRWPSGVLKEQSTQRTSPLVKEGNPIEGGIPFLINGVVSTSSDFLHWLQGHAALH